MGRSRSAFLCVLVVAATLAAARPANATLPTPSWWNGDCDANHWNAAAATKHWHGAGAHRLGASYLGVAVCGPRRSGEGAPDVQWTRTGWGEYEWECPELAMRFMALAYGVSAYNANGNGVVRNYSSSNGGGLVRINNATQGKAPAPGDVVSFDNPNSAAGHVAVVTATTVDASGNGTVKLMSQNDTSDGWRTLTLTRWRLGSFGTYTPYGWLHHPDGSTATNHPPYGKVDRANGLKGHNVHVRGWTIDPDTKRTPAKVVVVVAGTRTQTLANRSRPDVGGAYPAAGDLHGFDVTTKVPRAGKFKVDTFAIDTTDGSRTLIASRSVSVP